MLLLGLLLVGCGDGGGGKTYDYSKGKVADNEEEVVEEEVREPQPLPEEISIRVNLKAPEAHPEGLFCIGPVGGQDLACAEGEPISGSDPTQGKQARIDITIDQSMIDEVLVARVQGRDHNVVLREILGALTEDMYFAGLGASLRRPLDEDGYPATKEDGRPLYIQSQALKNPVILSSLSTARYAILDKQSGVLAATMLDGGLLKPEAVNALASFYRMYINAAPPEGTDINAKAEFGIMMNDDGELIDEEGRVFADFTGTPLSMNELFISQGLAREKQDQLIADLIMECESTEAIECPANMADHVSIEGRPLGAGVYRLKITQTHPEEMESFAYIDADGNPLTNLQGGQITHSMVEEAAGREDPIFITAEGYWKNESGDIVNYVSGEVLRASVGSDSPGVYTDKNGAFVNADGTVIRVRDDAASVIKSSLGDGLYEDTQGLVVRYDPATGKAVRVTLRTADGEDIIRTYYTWDIYREYKAAKEDSVRYEVEMCIPRLGFEPYPNPNTDHYTTRPAMREPYSNGDNTITTTDVEEGVDHATELFASHQSARYSAGQSEGERIGSQRGYWEGYFGMADRSADANLSETGKSFTKRPEATDTDPFHKAYKQEFADLAFDEYETGFDDGYSNAYSTAYAEGAAARAEWSPEQRFGAYSDDRPYKVGVFDIQSDPQGPYEAGRLLGIDMFQNDSGAFFADARTEAQILGQEYAEKYGLTRGSEKGVAKASADGFERIGPLDSATVVPDPADMESLRTAALDNLDWVANGDQTNKDSEQLYVLGFQEGFIKAYNDVLKENFELNFESHYVSAWKEAYEFSVAMAVAFAPEMIQYPVRDINSQIDSEVKADGATAAASDYSAGTYESDVAFLDREQIAMRINHARKLGQAKALPFFADDNLNEVPAPALAETYNPFVAGYVAEIMAQQHSEFWTAAQSEFTAGEGLNAQVSSAEARCALDTTNALSSTTFALSPVALARETGAVDGKRLGAFDREDGTGDVTDYTSEVFSENGLSGMALGASQEYWNAYWLAFEDAYTAEKSSGTDPAMAYRVEPRPYLPQPLLDHLTPLYADFSGEGASGASQATQIFGLLPYENEGLFTQLTDSIHNSGLPQVAAVEDRKAQLSAIFEAGRLSGEAEIEIPSVDADIQLLAIEYIDSVVDVRAVHDGLQWFAANDAVPTAAELEAKWSTIKADGLSRIVRAATWEETGSNDKQELYLMGYSEGYREAFLQAFKAHFDTEFQGRYEAVFLAQKTALNDFSSHVIGQAEILATDPSVGALADIDRTNLMNEWSHFIAQKKYNTDPATAKAEAAVDIAALIAEWRQDVVFSGVSFEDGLQSDFTNGFYSKHQADYWAAVEAEMVAKANEWIDLQTPTAPSTDTFSDSFVAAIQSTVQAHDSELLTGDIPVNETDPAVSGSARATFTINQLAEQLRGFETKWWATVTENTAPAWWSDDPSDTATEYWESYLAQKKSEQAGAAAAPVIATAIDCASNDEEKLCQSLTDYPVQNGALPEWAWSFTGAALKEEAGTNPQWQGYVLAQQFAPNLELIARMSGGKLKAAVDAAYNHGLAYGSCQTEDLDVINALKGADPTLSKADAYSATVRGMLVKPIREAYELGVSRADAAADCGSAVPLDIEVAEVAGIENYVLGYGLGARFLMPEIQKAARLSGTAIASSLPGTAVTQTEVAAVLGDSGCGTADGTMQDGVRGFVCDFYVTEFNKARLRAEADYPVTDPVDYVAAATLQEEVAIGLRYFDERTDAVYGGFAGTISDLFGYLTPDTWFDGEAFTTEAEVVLGYLHSIETRSLWLPDLITHAEQWGAYHGAEGAEHGYDQAVVVNTNPVTFEDGAKLYPQKVYEFAYKQAYDAAFASQGSGDSLTVPPTGVEYNLTDVEQIKRAYKTAKDQATYTDGPFDPQKIADLTNSFESVRTDYYAAIDLTKEVTFDATNDLEAFDSFVDSTAETPVEGVSPTNLDFGLLQVGFDDATAALFELPAPVFAQDHMVFNLFGAHAGSTEFGGGLHNATEILFDTATVVKAKGQWLLSYHEAFLAHAADPAYAPEEDATFTLQPVASPEETLHVDRLMGRHLADTYASVEGATQATCTVDYSVAADLTGAFQAQLGCYDLWPSAERLSIIENNFTDVIAHAGADTTTWTQPGRAFVEGYLRSAVQDAALNSEVTALSEYMAKVESGGVGTTIGYSVGVLDTQENAATEAYRLWLAHMSASVYDAQHSETTPDTLSELNMSGIDWQPVESDAVNFFAAELTGHAESRAQTFYSANPTDATTALLHGRQSGYIEGFDDYDHINAVASAPFGDTTTKTLVVDRMDAHFTSQEGRVVAAEVSSNPYLDAYMAKVEELDRAAFVDAYADGYVAEYGGSVSDRNRKAAVEAVAVPEIPVFSEPTRPVLGADIPALDASDLPYNRGMAAAENEVTAMAAIIQDMAQQHAQGDATNRGFGFKTGYLHSYYSGDPRNSYHDGTGIVRDMDVENVTDALLAEQAKPSHVLPAMTENLDDYRLGYEHGYIKKHHEVYMDAYLAAFQTAYANGESLGSQYGYGADPLSADVTNPPDDYRDQVAIYWESGTGGNAANIPAIDPVELGRLAGRSAADAEYSTTAHALAHSRLKPWGEFNAYRHLMDYHSGSNSTFDDNEFSPVPDWNTNVTSATDYSNARIWGYQQKYLEVYLAGAKSGYAEGYDAVTAEVANAANDSTTDLCVNRGRGGELLVYNDLPSDLTSVFSSASATPYKYDTNPASLSILAKMFGEDEKVMGTDGRVMVQLDFDTFTSRDSPDAKWSPLDFTRPNPFPNEDSTNRERSLEWWQSSTNLGMDINGASKTTHDGGFNWERTGPSSMESSIKFWDSAYRDAETIKTGQLPASQLSASIEMNGFYPADMNKVHPSHSAVSRFRKANTVVRERVRQSEYRYFNTTGADESSVNRPAVLNLEEYYLLQGMDLSAIVHRDEEGNITDSEGRVLYRAINVGGGERFEGIYQEVVDADKNRGYLVDERGERIKDWVGVIPRDAGLPTGETWDWDEWRDDGYDTSYFLTVDIEHFFLANTDLSLDVGGSIIDQQNRIVRAVDGSGAILPAAELIEATTFGPVNAYKGVSGTEFDGRIYEIDGYQVVNNAQENSDPMDSFEFEALLAGGYSYLGQSVFNHPDGYMVDGAGNTIVPDAADAFMRLHPSGLFVDEQGRLIEAVPLEDPKESGATYDAGKVVFSPVGKNLYTYGEYVPELGVESAEYGASTAIYRLEDINQSLDDQSFLNIANSNDRVDGTEKTTHFVMTLGEYEQFVAEGLTPTGTHNAQGRPVFYDEEGSLVSANMDVDGNLTGEVTVMVAAENAPPPKPSFSQISDDLAEELSGNQFTSGYDFDGQVKTNIQEDTEFSPEYFDETKSDLGGSEVANNDSDPVVLGSVNGLSLSGRSFVHLKSDGTWRRVAFELNGKPYGTLQYTDSSGNHKIHEYKMLSMQLSDGSWQVKIDGKDTATVSPSMSFEWKGVTYESPGLSVHNSDVMDRKLMMVGRKPDGSLGYIELRSTANSVTITPHLPGLETSNMGDKEFKYGTARLWNGRTPSVNANIIAMPGKSLFGNLVRQAMHPQVAEGVNNRPVWHTSGSTLSGQSPNLLLERDQNYNMIPVPSDPYATINLTIPNFRRVKIGGTNNGNTRIEFWQFLPTMEGNIIGWETNRSRPRSIWYPQKQGLPDVTITSSGGDGTTTAVALRSKNIWDSGYRYHTYIGDMNDGAKIFAKVENFKEGQTGTSAAGAEINELFKVYDVVPWSSVGAGYYTVDDNTTIRLGSNGTLVSIDDSGAFPIPAQPDECAVDSNGNIIYEPSESGFGFSSQCVMITPPAPKITMDYLGDRRSTSGGDTMTGAGARKVYSRDVIRVEGRRRFRSQTSSRYNAHVQEWGAENVELLDTRRVWTWYGSETRYTYQVRMSPLTAYYILLENTRGNNRQRHVLAIYQSTDPNNPGMTYSLRRM